MAGYCTSVRLYFHEPQASENTAQECNIQPYCLLSHQIIDLLYTSVLPVIKVIVHMYIMGCTNRAIMSAVSNLPHHCCTTQPCAFWAEC